ncbi:hypothetical protein Hanom_Chr05g00445721 [Helianthus anomalus]
MVFFFFERHVMVFYGQPNYHEWIEFIMDDSMEQDDPIIVFYICNSSRSSYGVLNLHSCSCSYFLRMVFYTCIPTGVLHMVFYTCIRGVLHLRSSSCYSYVLRMVFYTCISEGVLHMFFVWCFTHAFMVFYTSISVDVLCMVF